MTTITLQKEIKKIVRKHEEIGGELKRLLTLTEELPDRPYYDDDRLTPLAIKRIRQAQRDFKSGKGILIRTPEELHKFFNEL